MFRWVLYAAVQCSAVQGASGTAQGSSGTAQGASGTAQGALGTAQRASGTAQEASGTAQGALGTVIEDLHIYPSSPHFPYHPVRSPDLPDHLAAKQLVRKKLPPARSPNISDQAGW
jgi:hypothetical protein